MVGGIPFADNDAHNDSTAPVVLADFFNEIAMSKIQASYQTSAIKRASRGELSRSQSSSDRAATVYGFSNYALKKTGAELKEAWSMASSSVRESKG